MDRRQLISAMLATGVVPSTASAAAPGAVVEEDGKAAVARQIGRFYSSFNEGEWETVASLLTPYISINFDGEEKVSGARERVVDKLKLAQANVRYRLLPRPTQLWLASDHSIKQIDPGPIWFPNDHTAVVMVQRADADNDGSDAAWRSSSPYDLVHIFSFLYSGNGDAPATELFNRIDMLRG